MLMLSLIRSLLSLSKNLKHLHRLTIINCLSCCSHTCYCFGMVSVTSASRYVTSASHYQSRPRMYIRGLIPWNSTELAEAVPIAGSCNGIRTSFLMASINSRTTRQPRVQIYSNLIFKQSKLIKLFSVLISVCLAIRLKGT